MRFTDSGCGAHSCELGHTGETAAKLYMHDWAGMSRKCRGCSGYVLQQLRVACHGALQNRSVDAVLFGIGPGGALAGFEFSRRWCSSQA